MNARIVVVAAVVASVFTGCGGDAPVAEEPVAATPAPTVEQQDQNDFWTEEQVLELSGIRASDDGLSYYLPGNRDCTAAVIMTTRGTVDLYKGAGDLVATNPAGDVGADVSPECLDAYMAALAAVKK